LHHSVEEWDGCYVPLPSSASAKLHTFVLDTYIGFLVCSSFKKRAKAIDRSLDSLDPYGSERVLSAKQTHDLWMVCNQVCGTLLLAGN